MLPGASILNSNKGDCTLLILVHALYNGLTSQITQATLVLTREKVWLVRLEYISVPVIFLAQEIMHPCETATDQHYM